MNPATGEEASSITTGSIAESYVEPLFVRFSPPAFLQRRALVLSTLKESETRCTSLLDVGTGEGGLLNYLVSCNDDVPIERLVGIDPDADEVENAVQNTRPSSNHKEELRWRPLEIALYLGGVADIPEDFGTFDCITAIEVLEHLDPPDVQALSRVCLGLLRPRCWIVTTPNRDFNEVFNRIDEGTGQSYTREGVPYVMRHDDHRFEMSKAEFESWAQTQCSKYSYKVRFSGVGSLENAFAGQKDWRRTFPEADHNRIFGYSTQAAIFESLEPRQDRDTIRTTYPKTELPNDVLRHITTHTYPWSENDDYPPTPDVTARLILGAEAFFRPIWNSEKDYSDETKVVVLIDCKELYETSYDLQRVSRFNFDKFLESVAPLMDRVLEASSNGCEVAGSSDLEGWHYELDAEPKAKLSHIQFIRVEEWRTCIRYIYDVSSFSAAGEVHSEDTISVGTNDWDVPALDEAVPVGDWYIPDDQDTAASLHSGSIVEW